MNKTKNALGTSVGKTILVSNWTNFVFVWLVLLLLATVLVLGMRVLTVLVISIPPSAQVPRVGDIEITKTAKTRIPNTKIAAQSSKTNHTNAKFVQFDTKIVFPALVPNAFMPLYRSCLTGTRVVVGVLVSSVSSTSTHPNA